MQGFLILWLNPEKVTKKEPQGCSKWLFIKINLIEKVQIFNKFLYRSLEHLFRTINDKKRYLIDFGEYKAVKQI